MVPGWPGKGDDRDCSLRKRKKVRGEGKSVRERVLLPFGEAEVQREKDLSLQYREVLPPWSPPGGHTEGHRVLRIRPRAQQSL